MWTFRGHLQSATEEENVMCNNCFPQRVENIKGSCPAWVVKDKRPQHHKLHLCYTETKTKNLFKNTEVGAVFPTVCCSVKLRLNITFPWDEAFRMLKSLPMCSIVSGNLVNAAPRPNADRLYATLMGAMAVRYTTHQQPLEIIDRKQEKHSGNVCFV